MTPETFDAFARIFPEPLLLTTQDGCILAANQAARHLFGLPERDEPGVRLQALVSDAPEKLLAYLGACARSRSMVLGALTVRDTDLPPGPHRCEGAVARPWSPEAEALIVLRMKPKPSTGTQFIRLNERIGELSQIIRARLQAEEALKESNRELQLRTQELLRSNRNLEQFAHVASHDLQEPLRTISQFTQLLERRFKGQLDSQTDEILRHVVNGAKWLQRLIRDLLAFSRVRSSEQTSLPIDCGRMVDKIMAELSFTRNDSGARVTRDALPVVQGDPTQFRQLFQNLIENAIKFQPPGHTPRVHLTAAREGHLWVFSVQDNGIGIEPEFQERIFQVFQRLHPQAEYEGTGIGLAICKEVVERHGGRIWVGPAPREGGSTFQFTLPAQA